MALIKCPECGKEISDKAGKCPNCGKIFAAETKNKICGECGKEVEVNAEECPYCGCPFEEKKTELLHSNSIVKTAQCNSKKIITVVLVMAITIITALLIYNVKVIKPKKIDAKNKEIYNEATELLEKGKYEEGKELLETISDYKDVSNILEQIKWESKGYACINEWKQVLKNPDSFVLHDISFYKEDLDEPDSSDKTICILMAGGQNGFGGNTSSYVLFSAENTIDAYCDTLDKEELDEDDDDAFIQLLGCTVINNYKENGKEVGTIDMSRMKKVLKNDAYSTIKIIE